MQEIQTAIEALLEEYKDGLGTILDMAKEVLAEQEKTKPTIETLTKEASAFDNTVVLAAKSTVVAFLHYIPLQGATKEKSVSNMAANLIFYDAIGYERYGMNRAFREAYNAPKVNGLNQFILRSTILAISLDGRIPEPATFANIIFETLTNTDVDMVSTNAKQAEDNTANAVAHIAGWTDYCSKCGRWVITDVQVTHMCDTRPIHEGAIDAAVGSALFGKG